MKVKDLEKIMMESIINPDKQKSIPVLFDIKNAFMYGAVKGLVKHFAYWINAELIKENYEKNSKAI